MDLPTWQDALETEIARIQARRLSPGVIYTPFFFNDPLQTFSDEAAEAVMECLEEVPPQSEVRVRVR